MAARPSNNRFRSLVIFLLTISHVERPISAANTKNDDTVIVNDAAESETAMLQKIDPEISSRSPPATANRRYNESTHFQGMNPERINGGQPAAIGNWPWMAALIRADGEFFCGGTLIDNQHILTAAHCFLNQSPRDLAYMTVRLGDYNIETNNEVRHTERRVKQLVQHPYYVRPPHSFNDVAILTMDAPVQFTRAIRPIRLPSGSQSYAGRTATAIGWGAFVLNGPSSAVLQEVTLPIWTNSECKRLYEFYRLNYIRDTSLCAGTVGKSVCQGDSGGPLVVYDGEWIQVGISSWVITCGLDQFPNVFARVSHFLPWIYENLRHR